MAGYHAPLLLPQPFCYTLDKWPRWQCRFEQFHMASGLSKEDQEKQVSTLLYCLGEEADDVLILMNISEESRKNMTMFSQNLMSTSKYIRISFWRERGLTAGYR